MTSPADLSFIDYAMVLWRRRVVVLLIAVGAVLVAGLALALQPEAVVAERRYRATDETLAVEAQAAVQLRLFAPELIDGLGLEVQRRAVGLYVAATGSPAQGRAFLERLPEVFVRPGVAPRPDPPDPEEGPGWVEPPAPPVAESPPIEPVAPARPPLEAWRAELATVESEMATAARGRLEYLTARALRLREQIEIARQGQEGYRKDAERWRREVEAHRLRGQARQDAHRQALAQHQAQVERRTAAHRARSLRLAAAASVPPARRLEPVHAVVMRTVGRPWRSVLTAAAMAGVALGVGTAWVWEAVQARRVRSRPGRAQTAQEAEA